MTDTTVSTLVTATGLEPALEPASSSRAQKRKARKKAAKDPKRKITWDRVWAQRALLAILLLLYVATIDIATRLIRNEICLVLALLGIASQFASPMQLAQSLIVATILFLLLLVNFVVLRKVRRALRQLQARAPAPASPPVEVYAARVPALRAMSPL